MGLTDPFTYYKDQAPFDITPADFQPQALAVTLQLTNVFLLLAALGVICTFTNNVSTARGFLIALAFADLGHIYAVYAAIGPAAFWDYASWNDMTTGNIGASVFLNINRWLTVLGVFGTLGGEHDAAAREKKQL